MRRPRWLTLLLGVVIAGAGCGGDQTSPLGPSTPAAEPLVAALKPLTPLLLTCTPLPAATKSAVIGKAGGAISVGPYTLVVPKDALKTSVTIKAEVVSSNVNSVRFSPEGLKFSRSATLTMGYSNCYGLGMVLPKKIVYTTEGLKLLEILNSIDLFSQQKVTTSLDHFSRYAIAY